MSSATGGGKEDDPYVYEVSTASELSEAVTAINADTSDSAYYTISLQEDIACSGLSFSKNTTTILGNGHTLTFKNYGGAIQVGSGTATHPVLILGGAQDTLTIEGEKSNDTYFIGVGAINGGTEYGTLKMCDGVTITGATGNNYFGGAVTVAEGGKFEMDGGTIKKCGIDGGSVCFGGGVAVINGGEFTMNGGSIQDCFLKTAVDYTDASYFQYLFGFDYQVMTETGDALVDIDKAFHEELIADTGNNLWITLMEAVVEVYREWIDYVFPRDENTHPFLAPCVRVTVDGKPVGVVGQVKTQLADAYHARKPIWLAELDLETLCDLHRAARIVFKALSVFPASSRDVTVIAPLTLSVAAVEKHIRDMRIAILEDVTLIDLYEPKDTEERNLTFRLTFRKADRTLKDAEVDKEREKVAQSLIKNLGVRI